jgi:hypothetical protein
LLAGIVKGGCLWADHKPGVIFLRLQFSVDFRPGAL